MPSYNMASNICHAIDTHFEVLFLDLNAILKRGEQYPRGPTSGVNWRFEPLALVRVRPTNPGRRVAENKHPTDIEA